MSNENSIDIKMLSHTCVFELKKTLDLFSADEQIWKELNHIHVLGLSLDFKELLSKVDEQFKNLGMNLFVNFENLSAERNDGVEYAKLSIFISSMIIAYIQENKIDANYLIN
ncbi:hypothetical protein C3420_14325, partial [Acinetobacter sp. ACNIH3]|uniref:hypothetical protein n=1 Tax=Acinetobacter sp. ACNIH3 TaxID=1985874 RepID=UPI000D4E78F4